MRAVILATMLFAIVSSEGLAGLGGVMRASSGRVHKVMVHGALAVLLCAGSACAPSIKMASENVANSSNEVAEQELIEEDHGIEKVEIVGNADRPFGAVDYLSVDRYLADKDSLTAEFYDSMLVHYLDDDANNFTALISLVDGKLFAQHSLIAQANEISIEQIVGVLVGEDPFIGSVAGVSTSDVLTINAIELPAAELEFELVGTINQIFTSNHYQLHLRGFIIDGQLITPPPIGGKPVLVFVHGDNLRIIATDREEAPLEVAPLLTSY